MVIFVKRELQKRGFFSRDFAGLPSNMSCGSREILLALGWLLCKENVLTKFMNSCTSPLDDEEDMLDVHEVRIEESCIRGLTLRRCDCNLSSCSANVMHFVSGRKREWSTSGGYNLLLILVKEFSNCCGLITS